jgi:anti-sigma B factor antagonist
MPLKIRLDAAHPGTRVFCLQGELEISEVGLLKDTLLPEIRRGACVVIDLSGLTYMDSAGLGVLIAAYKQAQKAGTILSLAAPPPEVSHVLAITGLDRFLPIARTVEDALGQRSSVS